MKQPSFFEKQTTRETVDLERVVLYALGNFQARGKVLAERDLPLDRLRGALKRAAEAFELEELTDESAVAILSRLGAEVRRVPSFVAKHPFRVIVPLDLAERARKLFSKIVEERKAASSREAFPG
ncbi:MAG: hypothetical protein WCB68_05950 [Pyrinomonadaceae bacterium]